MQQITFFCADCKKSLHVVFVPEGIPDKPVLEGVGITCIHCKRIVRFRAYTERKLSGMAHGSKIYV